ncbi:MAG: hypothetical protein IKW20_06505 [Bacteroidales bacterium]|nr:hypothetical protein [Bacteroidales bacterium]
MSSVSKVVAFLAAGVLLFFAGRCTAEKAVQTEYVERVDTLLVRDTIVRETPVYLRSEIIDTMYVQVRDTMVRNDTLYVRLPRESRTYGDERYTAVVSGYEPRLDRLEVYLETQTVTKYVMRHEPPKRWGIGVQAGYGVAASGGTIRLAPYIGIGISYDIVRW